MANLNRIRMASANSTAQLRGVAGEPTEGLTVNGSHNTSLDMHEFEVSISGNYTLYEDVDGGSTYVRRTDWSETTGKYVRGSDLEEDAREIHGVKYRNGYSSLLSQFKDGGDDFVAGEFHGKNGFVDEIDIQHPGLGFPDADYIKIQSGSTIRLPQGYKIDRTKTGGLAYGSSVFGIRNVTDVVIDGGEIDGNASNNGYYTEHDHGIEINDSERIVIKNMYIHNNSGDCVRIYNSKYVFFENCVFVNPIVNESAPLIGCNCVGVVGTRDGSVQHIHFTNCHFYGGNPSSIDLEPDDGATMYDIVISNCTFNGFRRGISIVPAAGNTVNRVTISNCIFKDYGYAIEIGSAGAGVVEDIIVSDCIVEGQGTTSSAYGIYLKRSSKVEINNVSIKKCEYGIYSNATMKELTIKNCRISENNQHGIYLVSSDEDVNLIGNYIFNNSQANADAMCGIFINAAKNVVLLNNISADTQSTPTQKTGLHIQNSDKLFLHGNIFFGNITYNLMYLYGCTNYNFGINYEGGSGFGIDKLYGRGSTPAEFDGKLKVDTIRFANARITAAATPGNFAANVVLVIENASGTAYYVPAMAATW